MGCTFVAVVEVLPIDLYFELGLDFPMVDTGVPVDHRDLPFGNGFAVVGGVLVVRTHAIPLQVVPLPIRLVLRTAVFFVAVHLSVSDSDGGVVDCRPVVGEFPQSPREGMLRKV